MKIAITVDTEKDMGFTDTRYGIDEGLPFVLDVFKEHDIKSTFFVSGETAGYLHETGMLKRIVRGSHEIASHGFTHADYRGWEYARVREEVCRSKVLLEEHTGNRISGYRAPQFLLDEKVVKAIGECGFAYDSSLPDVSGISAARTMRGVRTGGALQDAIRNSGLREFPIDSVPVARVPHGLMWVNLISIGLYRILFSRQEKDFMVFYLHAFDVIKDKRRLAMDLKRRIFYLRNENGVAELLVGLIRFWKSRGVTFTRLGDECV